MKKILTISLILLSLFGNSTTYYIDPTGNDATGTGSIVAPWATLKKATTSVTTAGDIIHVNAGTYTETLQSTLAVGISIEGDDSATTIIKSTLSSTNDAIIVASSTTGTNGNQHISNIQLNGDNRTTSWAIEIRGRSNFSIHDCSIKDFEDNGVYWTSRNDGLELPPSVFATGNTFYNNRVYNSSTYTTFGHGGLVIGGQDGMLVYNNVFNQTGRTSGTNGYCIKYANDGHLKDCKIYNNSITKEPYDGTSWDFAVELFNVSGLEIYGNTCIGAMDFNYQPKLTYAYSVYVHDNIIGPLTQQSQYERGVIFEFDCETVRIENNTFRNLSNPIYYSTRNLTVISNNSIKGNNCYNIGNSSTHEGYGIRFISDGSASFICTNLTIEHNTFAGDSINDASRGISIADGGDIRNTTIKNNIFTHFGYSYLVADPASVVDTLLIENNLVYNSGFSNDLHWIGGTALHVTNTGNILLNPWYDTGYTLKTGSPAIGTATDGTDIGYTGGSPSVLPKPRYYIKGKVNYRN